MIQGGLTSGVAPIATFGGNEWEAQPGKLFEAFRVRCGAAAKAEVATHIVFGGAPSQEMIASGYFQRHHPELCDLLCGGQPTAREIIIADC